MNIFRFVKAAAAEGNRKSFQSRVGSLCRVMQDCGRIDSAAEPDAERNIGDQVFSNCVLQQRVEFFLRRVKSEIRGDAKGQAPVGARGELSVGPFQPISRRKFLYAVHQCPGAGDIIQREVAIEALQTETTIDLRMNE